MATNATFVSSPSTLSPSFFCFAPPSGFTLGVALFIMIGTFISYLFQYLSIYRSKSSYGLSLYMLTISLAASWLTGINSAVLKWDYISCCWHLGWGSIGKCLLNNLSTEQLLVPLFCFSLLFALFLAYFDMHPPGEGGDTPLDRFKARRTAYWLFFGCTIFFVALSIVAGVMYYSVGVSGVAIQRFAKVCGVASSFCFIAQWLPQIVTTWRFQSVGSLSVLMLVVQFPGAFLIVYFQGVLYGSSWTTWVPYVFGGSEQVVLVLMCLFFYVRDIRTGKIGIKKPWLRRLFCLSPLLVRLPGDDDYDDDYGVGGDGGGEEDGRRRETQPLLGPDQRSVAQKMLGSEEPDVGRYQAPSPPDSKEQLESFISP